MLLSSREPFSIKLLTTTTSSAESAGLVMCVWKPDSSAFVVLGAAEGRQRLRAVQPDKKVTWGKFRFGTPKFIVKSYVFIVVTLIFALI
jgi:hypothetical protein